MRKKCYCIDYVSMGMHRFVWCIADSMEEAGKIAEQNVKYPDKLESVTICGDVVL